MTKDTIEKYAKLHKVDFLIISDTNAYPFKPSSGCQLIHLKAPYIPKKFIRDIDSMTPVGIYIRYFSGKGLIHWLAWKLRRLI